MKSIELNKKFRSGLAILLCALIGVAFAGGVYAQEGNQSFPVSGAAKLDTVEKRVMAPVDVPALIEEDIRNETMGEPPRFALPLPVDFNPGNSGTWEKLEGDRLLWRLRISAPEAVSLNFGWTRYWLPPSGQMLLYTPDEKIRRGHFSAQDNAVHGEFWSPIIEGSDVVIEVTVSAEERSALELNLTSVNYGYRKFGESALKSGSCNVDVICSQGDAWRDQIRSVAVYSRNGSFACTGALVNNVAQDRKPYFLTANHCGVTAGNAATVVTYWNYQNSTCRPPGSGSSGGPGDGPLTQFVTGAIFRAASAPSDFTLLEIDEPVPAAFNPFWAGWDNTTANPNSAITIHHPQTDEKRISFENDPVTTTSYGGTTSPGDGTHIRVADWDLGTTEPGSSGSPLFNPAKRIIGQLHGGGAACGNDLPDWYGRVSTSWTGGGTSATRLRDWLDPTNTGATVLDGISGAVVAGSADLSITKTDGVTTAVPGGSVTYTITASNAGPDAVTGATVADTFPAVLTATWTCVGAGGGTCTAAGSGNINDTINLPAGGSVTYTVNATISASATGTLSNTATVSSATTDPNPANNSATDTDTLTPQADLAITKTDGVTSVPAGGSVTYTIVASNSGPSNAPGATVADTFPAALTGVTWTCVGAGGGTCTAAGSGNINDTVNLPAGGSVTYTVNATVSPSATGTLSNTATVSAPAGVADPNSENNSATDTDTITAAASADLSVTKTGTAGPVAVNSNITYTINVANAGPGAAASVVMNDPLPSGTTFVSLTSPAGWTCTTPAVGTNGTVNCTRPTLASGASGSFTLVVRYSSNLAFDQMSVTITNTATVSSATTDPNAANNSASASTRVGVSGGSPTRPFAGLMRTNPLEFFGFFPMNDAPDEASPVALFLR